MSVMQNEKDQYCVSVIIPTYNRREILNYTLISLAKQDFDKDKFEVIVIDDGSNDGTDELVRSYEGKMNLVYHFLKDRGHTPATARNKGILLSKGKVCLFIDSGVSLNTNCIREHVKFYEERPTHATVIGYVYGFFAPEDVEEKMKELFIPDDPYESCRLLSENDIFRDVRDRHYFLYNDRLEDLPAPWFYYWSCHISANREDLLRVGMFDESYNGRWGVEDNDLGFRLQQEGIKIYLLRSAETIHYPHYRNRASMLEDGTNNCIYFHNKFQTLETKLFLDYYMHPDFIDINRMSMEMQVANKIV